MAASLATMVFESKFFALAGVVAVSYLTLKFIYSCLKGIRAFIIAKAIGVGKNLRKYGEWAGAFKVHDKTCNEAVFSRRYRTRIRTTLKIFS